MFEIIVALRTFQQRFPHCIISIAPPLARIYHGYAQTKYNDKAKKILARLAGCVKSKRINYTGNVRLLELHPRIMFGDPAIYDHDEFRNKAIHFTREGLGFLCESFWTEICRIRNCF